MERTGNYISLLLGSKLNEVYCIARNTDSKLRIILGMLLRIQKSISVKYVYVKMETAFFNISIE